METPASFHVYLCPRLSPTIQARTEVAMLTSRVFLVQANGRQYHPPHAPTAVLGRSTLGGLRPPMTSSVFDRLPQVRLISAIFAAKDPPYHTPPRPDHSFPDRPSPPTQLPRRAFSLFSPLQPEPSLSMGFLRLSPLPSRPSVALSVAVGELSSSSLITRGPLTSSRTRARTAAASGTPKIPPSYYFPGRPRITVIPRPPLPNRRPTASAPAPATPRLTSIPFSSTSLAQPPPPAPPRPALASPCPSDTLASPPPSAQASPPAPLSSPSARPLPPAPLPLQFSLHTLCPPPPRHLPRPRHPSTPPAHLRDCLLHYTRTDWAAKQSREPVCSAVLHCLFLGLPPNPSTALSTTVCQLS